MAVSGGKDSSYAVLQLKRKFGLRVEAFTYAHDGLNDFALRNAREVCKAVNVRHHVLSLPNHAHLRSFRAFFKAWIESREPVAAAMTCVACKNLHVLGTRLARDIGAPLIVWSVCPLEIPPFIPTQPERPVGSKSKSVTGLAGLLGRKLLTQPSLRRAVLGTPGICVLGSLAFRPKSGYLQLRYPSVNHIDFFDYCSWNGTQIMEALQSQTPWSIPSSVVSDWHSDCLFNVFKEYMFQRMFGLSYTDAFLSNLIRHGLITREEAWRDLVRSKSYYAEEVPKALSVLGMERLRSKCDPTCFNIEG